LSSYVVTKDVMEWVLNNVLKDSEDRNKQYVSPVLAQSFANLPPARIITAGYDPHHADGEDYGEKLREKGIYAHVTRYENSFHGFLGNYIDSYSEAEEAMFECTVCLREAFGVGEFKSPKLKQYADTSGYFNL